MRIEWKNTLIEGIETKAAGGFSNSAPPLEVKADGDGFTVEGYASVFSVEDHGGDIVMPGAFAESLKTNGHRIKFMFGHYTPIGRVTEAAEDAVGLKVKARVSNTEQGRDTMTLIRDGVIDRMSIGYRAKRFSYKAREGSRDEWDRIRLLEAVDLFEVSAVVMPMNEHAAITGVKSEAGGPDLTVAGLLAVVTDPARRAAFEAKAGRVLSKANMGRLKAAVNELLAVLSAAGDDDEAGAEDEGKGAQIVTGDPDLLLTFKSAAEQIRAIRIHTLG